MTARAADAVGRSGEAGRIAALVKLHLTLTYRHSSGSSRAARLGATIAATLVILWVAAIAFGCAWIVCKLSRGIGPATAGMQGVFVFFGLFLSSIFAGAGLFEKGMGCGIDLGRLFHLPVPTRSMLLAGLVARLAAPHSLLPIGVVVGYWLAVVGAGDLVRAVVFLPCAALWLLHLHLLSMVCSLLTVRARRSRRFAEIAMAVGGVFFVVYLVIIFTPLAEGMDAAVRQLFAWVKAHWLALQPVAVLLPGVSPLTSLNAGSLAPLVLVVALAEALGMYGLCRLLLDRIAVSLGAETTSSSAAKSRTSAGTRRRAWLGSWVDRLPLCRKDLRLTVRDPNTRLEMLMIGSVPVFGGLLLARHHLGAVESLVHFVLAPVMLLLFKERICNHLCREASGLLAVLSSSVPRWRVLAEKNLANLVLVLLLMAVPLGAMMWRGATPRVIALDLVYGAALALPLLGAGNLLAILLPVPQAVKKGQLRPQVPMGQLFLTELVQLAVLPLVMLTALPVFAAHAVLIGVPTSALAATAAAAMSGLYALGIYLVLLLLGERLFTICEPDLFEKVIRASG
jgi:hypothetical protein